MARSPHAPLLALLLWAPTACAYRPPLETPALVAAAGPVRTVALPADEPLRVALRAGSAHDPPGREGLAWVTARAVADAAGATVEVGPDVVVFTAPADRAAALADALVAPPSLERVLAARESAMAALGSLDCAGIAERAWDTWIYAGHPYGHAPEGRLSVLPTLTVAEVGGFQGARYVRSVAVVGVPAGASVPLSAFDVLPPRLSTSPVPSVRLPLPPERVLIVHADDRRCVVAGHPAAVDVADARLAAALAPGDVVASARREPRRLARLPLAPERDPGAVVAEVLGGGWLPLWQASRVLAPEATIPPARALADALLALDPYPSLARPIRPASQTADVATAPPVSAQGELALDAALTGWLTAADVRAVVVIPADAPLDLESFGAPAVQSAVPFLELLR